MKLYANTGRAVICFLGGFGFPEPLNLALWASSGVFCALGLWDILTNIQED
jgi:hypothetical protein